MPKKILLFFIGIFFLIAGITLVLRNWDEVIVLFKAVIGMILAVGGLVVLTFIHDEKN